MSASETTAARLASASPWIVEPGEEAGVHATQHGRASRAEGVERGVGERHERRLPHGEGKGAVHAPHGAEILRRGDHVAPARASRERAPDGDERRGAASHRPGLEHEAGTHPPAVPYGETTRQHVAGCDRVHPDGPRLRIEGQRQRRSGMWVDGRLRSRSMRRDGLASRVGDLPRAWLRARGERPEPARFPDDDHHEEFRRPASHARARRAASGPARWGVGMRSRAA